ncbi:MAG: polyprenol monophosphomannose synthase [Planctomycetota bacterium]
MSQSNVVRTSLTTQEPGPARSVGEVWIAETPVQVESLVRDGVDSKSIRLLPPDGDPAERERVLAAARSRDPVPWPAPTPQRHRCLVVVPTYNEIDNLEPIVTAIRHHLDTEVLIVDDGSPDGTGDLADELHRRWPSVHVLHRTAKEGLGKAYLAGFRWALDRDYQRIFEMDADFSHAPWDLPRLVRATEDAELVIGSRYRKGGNTSGWSWHRRLISQAGNFYTRTFLGYSVRDWTAGFRCFRAEMLRQLDFDAIESDGYGFQIEMTWRVRRAGGRIAEVPVHFVDRREGQSKMTGGIAREAMLRVPAMRFKKR